MQGECALATRIVEMHLRLFVVQMVAAISKGIAVLGILSRILVHYIHYLLTSLRLHCIGLGAKR